MPVTHSPGNPFAFSPALQRGPAFTDAEDFQHYKSPRHAPLSQQNRRSSAEDSQRDAYAIKQYKENVTHDLLLKDARIEELERLVLEESKKMERTESDKRFLFDLQEKQAAELTTLKEEMANLKKGTDSSVRELRTSNKKLKDAQISLEDEQRARDQSHQRELDQLNGNMENQRRAMDTLKADLTMKNDMLAEKNTRIDDLERRLDDQAVPKASESPEDLAFVTKELAEAIQRVTSLEIANGNQLAIIHKLQEANAGIAVLKEQNTSLQGKLSAVDVLREDLAETQIKLSSLEAEKASWLKLLGGDSDATDILAVLAKQREDLETAEIERQVMEDQLNESNRIVAQVRKDLITKSGRIEELSASLDSETRTVTRLERSKAMGTREIQFLREQLASYDLEEEVESPNYDALKSTRIKQLESLLDEARNQPTPAPPPLASEGEEKVLVGVKRARESTDFNEIERGEYLRKIRSLNADLEITRRQGAVLQRDLDALRTSQSAPRILQLKKNPTVTYHATRTTLLDSLRLENASLRDELLAKGGVTVPIQSLRNCELEMETLRGEVRQREKMISRLKAVFASKSSEFREAVYSLLGYKLDFLPNGRVRLTSMYAEDTDHAFVFDGEAGTMQLSGETAGNEAFMESVGNLIKYWSGEKNSIPGMLSALTLELLDKQQQGTTGQ